MILLKYTLQLRLHVTFGICMDRKAIIGYLNENQVMNTKKQWENGHNVFYEVSWIPPPQITFIYNDSTIHYK